MDALASTRISADAVCARASRRAVRRAGRRGQGEIAGADGLRDMRSEDRKSREIEEGGPHHGVVGLQDARGDDRGDRVRGVVKAVDEVEEEGGQDDRPDQDEVAVLPLDQIGSKIARLFSGGRS